MDTHTPRTDKESFDPENICNGYDGTVVDSDIARQIERERNLLFDTMMKIAMTDYRGNRSTESQLAYDTITSMGYAPHK